MKIKQSVLVKAYQTTDKFSTDSTISLELKWKLYQLRQILRPFYDFQVEQENLIRQKYAPYADREGKIYGQQYSDFLSELEALSKLEMDVDIHEPIQISLTNQSVFTIQDLETLEYFVKFVINE